MLARLAAELFNEPGPEWQSRWQDQAVLDQAVNAAKTLGLPSALVCDIALAGEDLEAIGQQHLQLFGHTVRSQCPPYELEYGRSDVFQQSQALADIAGFYVAFGASPGGALSERPDHVIAEWEFLCWLAAKERHACDQGMTDAAQHCREAQRKFLADHAAAWMPAFHTRLGRASPAVPFYAGVARLAGALLEEWCQSFDVDVGEPWMELREVSEDDVEITCGAGGGSVELGPTLADAMRDRS